MSWMQRLMETYDACVGAEQFASDPPAPVSHTPQQAHIEIVLNEKGEFQTARIVDKVETLVPATELSAGRVGTAPPPHPLCDKIQYVAKDYKKRGGAKPPFFEGYTKQLRAWCSSEFTHPKASAVLCYVEGGSVIADLIAANVLAADANGQLLTGWDGDGEKPAIFRLLTGGKGEQDQGGAFVRWVVEIPGDLDSSVWRDSSLQTAWQAYNETTMTSRGLCMATGASGVALTRSHPKRLRHAMDGAKLISSNDNSGFTFRGRFTDASGEQACGIGYLASQKAHLALRWLVGRQAYRNDSQAVVAWEVNGGDIPRLQDIDVLALYGLDGGQEDIGYHGDAGQAYALALKSKIAGYGAKLRPNSRVIVMALDSATPGRMAITYYREYGGAEFLARVEDWHSRLAWKQSFGKDRRFVGAPAPTDIVKAAFGPRADDKLVKSSIERLLPCITDGRRLPRDIVDAAVNRAKNRAGLEEWDWVKTLGIACSLYKGYYPGRNYEMSLQEDSTSRDYLYGRLLALADWIEESALRLASEKRPTTAARLMQRFADHPFQTYRNIELSLTPYLVRIGSRRPGTLHLYKSLVDEVSTKFLEGDFAKPDKLSGEFLLGYHCQRAKLYEKKIRNENESTQPEEEDNDHTAA